MTPFVFFWYAVLQVVSIFLLYLIHFYFAKCPENINFKCAYSWQVPDKTQVISAWLSNQREIVCYLWKKEALNNLLKGLKNTHKDLGSCGGVAVIVVVRLLVWRNAVGLAGPYAGQMRAGGDQVSNANKSYACAIQVHLTQLHTTQELQTWGGELSVSETCLY